MPKIFIYDSLMSQDLQEEVWGESKEGKLGRVLDFELRLWEDSLASYLERMIGGTVVGKIYEVSKEQLDATDEYYSDTYERITIRTKNSSFETWIKNRKPKVEKKSKKKKGKKK